MADFRRLWDMARTQHTEDYYSALKVADETRNIENHAAIVIQSVFRGHRVRSEYRLLRQHVALIIKTYRSYRDRVNYRSWQIAELNERRRKAYHDGATKLQSLWRGYKSRKEIKDMRVRKSFLNNVATGCSTIKVQLDDYVEKKLQWETQRKKEQADLAYKRRVEREHHMLSTITKPGVYAKVRKPGVNEKDLIASVVGLSQTQTQTQIQTQTQTQTQTHTRGRHCRRSLGSTKHPLTNASFITTTTTTTTPTTTTLKRPQGPFRSAEDVWTQRNKPLRPSLRAQTDFDHRRVAEVAAKDAEWLSRLHDDNFTPVSRHARPFARYEKKLVGAAPFTDYQDHEFRQTMNDVSFTTTVKAVTVFDDLNSTY